MVENHLSLNKLNGSKESSLYSINAIQVDTAGMEDSRNTILDEGPDLGLEQMYHFTDRRQPPNCQNCPESSRSLVMEAMQRLCHDEHAIEHNFKKLESAAGGICSEADVHTILPEVEGDCVRSAPCA